MPSVLIEVPTHQPPTFLFRGARLLEPITRTAHANFIWRRDDRQVVSREALQDWSRSADHKGWLADVASTHSVALTEAGGEQPGCVHGSNPRFDGLPWLIDTPMEMSDWVGETPKDAQLKIDAWIARYVKKHNVAEDDLDDVGFQLVAFETKFAESSGLGFGDTGDKARSDPNEKFRVVKRYDRHKVEDELIATINALGCWRLPTAEPFKVATPLPPMGPYLPVDACRQVSMVPHDEPQHVMPSYDRFFENNYGLPQSEQELDGIRREVLGELPLAEQKPGKSPCLSWRKLHQQLRKELGLPRRRPFEPPVKMTALEYHWAETRLAAVGRKEYEAEKKEDQKKYYAMLSEARALAVASPGFATWELEWKAYWASRGRKNRPKVSPPPAAECEWYGQLCHLRDLFTRPGKSIIKQSRSGRVSGEKLRDEAVHTVQFEKQWEMRCAGIRIEVEEGKYNETKLKVDAIQYVTTLKEMTSSDAGELLGKKGPAVRKDWERRRKTLSEGARSRTPLGAVTRERDEFLKAAPDGVERGWYVLIQLPRCEPQLCRMETPINDTNQALQDVAYDAMLKLSSEMTARKIVKYGRKKISPGKTIELAEDTPAKVRAAFYMGRVYTPEDCDCYNPSPQIVTLFR